jgi:hypothetical protein
MIYAFKEIIGRMLYVMSNHPTPSRKRQHIRQQNNMTRNKNISQTKGSQPNRII